MIVNNLIEFGLSDKEARTYLALLELEVAGAHEMSKKSGINRSSTYVVLEALQKCGLVNLSVENKLVRQYVAVSPEILLDQAKKRTDNQIRIRELIESVMPNLKALHKDTKHKPKVYIYEGDESISDLYFKGLPSRVNDLWRGYENLSKIGKHLPGYLEKDYSDRVKSGVKLTSINPNTTENTRIMQQFQIPGGIDTNILIPEKKFFSSKQIIDFGIYGDNVTFTSFDESFCIVIKHEQIAHTLKNIFDLAWKEAERIGKKYKN